jgi:hypothetical protein
MGNGGTEDDKKLAVVAQAFAAEDINMQSATDAFKSVMEKVGCSLHRDTLDQRIIQNVKDRTGQLIDVQGNYPHGTPYEQTVSAWPVLKSVPALPDSDKDGMPDDWEKKNGLNPNDASDAGKIALHGFYSNVEVYINSLIK